MFLLQRRIRPTPRKKLRHPRSLLPHPIIDAINQFASQGIWRELHEGRKRHPKIKELYQDLLSIYIRPSHITRQVHELRFYLKEQLCKFAQKFRLEALFVENTLTIPTNLQLGLALTEFIAETDYPFIANHHDFYWERQRFLNNSVQDYLDATFPPALPSIRHVVINSVQATHLASLTGVNAVIIPNLMDYDTPPTPLDEYAQSVRADLGLAPDQYLILQPTHIIQRKGNEHAIELTHRLGVPAELVISHAAGYEGTDYEKRVCEFADMLNVTINFESAIVGEPRGVTSDGRRIYILGDVYPQAVSVTYPSSMEGFGNAFLEAIYYKLPLVVNNYSIYETDIKPKGFKVVEFDVYINNATLKHARRVLLHPEETVQDALHNYELAHRYYSFGVLERRLRHLLPGYFGEMI